MSTRQTEPALIPTKTMLRGQTWLKLEQIAKREHTTVAVVLSVLADQALNPQPAKRQWVRITPERAARIAELHAVGVSPVEIARRIGCSASSVRNHLGKAQG